MNTFKIIVTKLPIPICGLALALASLGNLLMPLGTFIHNLCGVLSLLIITFFSIRAFINFGGILKDLKHPVGFSVLPTYCMTLMLLSGYLKPYSSNLAIIIWSFALVLNIIILLFFIRRFVIKLNIENVYPSWFVMFVGFVVASVSSPSVGMENVGKVIFYIGFSLYLIILPFILYRTFKVKKITRALLPTAAIFTAPGNLCIVGHLSVFGENANHTVIVMLMLIALISYVGVLISLTYLLKLEFYPSFAAFTFPLVISAISIQKLESYFNLQHSMVFLLINIITTSIATFIVLYVFIKYILFLYNEVKLHNITNESELLEISENIGCK